MTTCSDSACFLAPERPGVLEKEWHRDYILYLGVSGEIPCISLRFERGELSAKLA